MNKLLFLQLCRFGVVGCFAAAVHFSIVILLVSSVGLKPLSANVFAFFVAFQISYSGHRFWTFRDANLKVTHRVTISKLLFVQISNFIANESLFYLFMTWLQLPYQLALLLVLMILPIATFTISKLWVFR